jgi:CIC family chloride channel protein
MGPLSRWTAAGDGPGRRPRRDQRHAHGYNRPPAPGDGQGPPPRPMRLRWSRAASARVSRWLTEAPYVKKWAVLGVVIGVIAGCGAVVFYEALQLATRFFLQFLAGYRIPTPFGEGNYPGAEGPARAWALPLIVGGGALLGAIAVFRFAPDAEGHGTDAAISAVHHNPRGVRLRTVVVKIIASALTIGSGGSGGREGPTGQISAGFGSFLARVLDLQPYDARIAVATGIGSGIGSIFGAPLGGAVLAAEVLYKEDFDPAALLPSFIASGIGYAIFGAAEGYTPLFGYARFHFGAASQLVWFALIGIVGGLIGLLYAKGFYGLNRLFARSPLPRWANPAVAGVLVGATGIAVPEVLGTGYGWIQRDLGPQLSSLPLWIVLVVPFARIVATGLSIGSGGSGGIFGPGMVIGAFVGAAVWRLFDPVFPSMGHDPAPYVVVGMMCCFGSVARAPLAVMIMVAEMTGSLASFEPGLIAVGIAWLIVRSTNETMYRSQLDTRSAGAGQRLLVGMPLLANVTAGQAMAPPRLVFADQLSASEGMARLERAGVTAAPVVDPDGRFEGTVTHDGLEAVADADRGMRSAIDAGAPAVAESTLLSTALDAFGQGGIQFLTVLDKERRVVGTLAIGDLVRTYRSQLLARLDQGAGNGQAGLAELVVAASDPLAGRAVRDAPLPPGSVVVAIRRGRGYLTPAGDTVLQEGDALTLLHLPGAPGRGRRPG